MSSTPTTSRARPAGPGCAPPRPIGRYATASSPSAAPAAGQRSAGERVERPARGQRGDRSGRADQGEQPDVQLGEVVLRPGEQERDGGPEAGEAAEPARRDQRAPAQHRFGAGDVEHAAQLLAVADGELRAVVGQGAAQRHRGERHDRGGDAVDRPPSGQPGDHPGERARHQDADQQAAHQRADHPAALVVAGQRRGVGDEHLHDHRGDAAQRDGRVKHGQAGGERADRQGDRTARQQAGEQRATAHDVAGRHDEQQPDGVAELPDRHEQRRAARPDVQRVADRVQQRLRVVQVGHGHRAGDGHQPDQARGEAVPGAAFSGRGSRGRSWVSHGSWTGGISYNPAGRG